MTAEQSSELNLRGGVIIIGSLLWDNEKRCKWRNGSLDLSTKLPSRLRIRYGRESSSRCDTYTMIFSSDRDTRLGQGYVVGYKNVFTSEKDLRREAIELAKAEGIWTTRRPFVACDWGAVALLANMSKPGCDQIKSIWAKDFNELRSTRFCHLQYRFEGDDQPVISEDGFLQMDPSPEISDFDFLLATPTVPKPARALTSKEIADKMIKQDYRDYFKKNQANGITTFQDDEILGLLRSAPSLTVGLLPPSP